LKKKLAQEQKNEEKEIPDKFSATALIQQATKT
jgi:hypothetical protein